MAEVLTEIGRTDSIKILKRRDGKNCFLCKKPFKSDEDITFDHWTPQSYGRANGWPEDKIQNLKNIRLAHKPCNAKKGNLVPVDNYTVPVREDRDPFRTRAIKRGQRPEICDTCMSGRILLPGEQCPDCGSGPQPTMAPQALTVKPKDCDHSTYNCWICFLGFVPKRPAIVTVLDGEFLDE